MTSHKSNLVQDTLLPLQGKDSVINIECVLPTHI